MLFPDSICFWISAENQVDMLMANLKTAEKVLQELIQQDESDDEE